MSIGTVTSIPVSALTAEDRCDACGAQAYAYVVYASGDLLFCAHHWREYAPVLKKTSLRYLDQTANVE